MPIEIKENLVLLCEGQADQNFFKSLIKHRQGIPKFDMLNPQDHYGRDGFQKTLEALRGSGGLPDIKGILIVADSHDDPTATFKHICNQIKDAGGYPIPTKPLELAPGTADHPPIAIMLLPGEGASGSLESLCIQVFTQRHDWIQSCVDQFLSCSKIEAHTWPPEKLSKAQYQCMVAALHREDPSRAISYAFRGEPPLLDVKLSCFDDVEKKLKEFCSAVGVL